MQKNIKINGNEADKISSFLSSTKKKNMAIFTHDMPDIDAISSAYAMQLIANKFKIDSELFYGGEISHVQNKAMLNVFDLDFIKISDLDDSQIEAYREKLKDSIIVVVDTSMFGFGNCKGSLAFFDESKKPDIIIDHHSYDPINIDVFINKETVSCSSIMSVLLKKLKIRMDEKIKTALFLGLMKDSDDFKQKDSITDIDREVYDDLRGKINLELYLRVINCPKPRALIGFKGKAFSKFIKQEGNCAVCGVGFLKSSQYSFTAEICDDLMTYDEVERCCSLGIIDDGIGTDKYLIASFRNSGDTINAHEFVRKIFGKNGAGGRKGAGGARIMLGDIQNTIIDSISDNEEELDKYFKIVYRSYADKILAEIKAQ